MPKYTHINIEGAGAKKDDSDEEDAPVWKGWNDAGIKRYNALCQIVKADREAHQDVDKLILDNIMQSSNTRKRPKKRAKIITTQIKPFVEEEDSDSDGQSNSATESVSDSNSVDGTK